MASDASGWMEDLIVEGAARVLVSLRRRFRPGRQVAVDLRSWRAGTDGGGRPRSYLGVGAEANLEASVAVIRELAGRRRHLGAR